MGRYKLGPRGAYFDPNDSGPDQASPEQIQALQQPQAPLNPTGGYQPPTGGINPGPNPQPMPQLPNIPGTPGWNGGFTGGFPGDIKAGPAWPWWNPGGQTIMPVQPPLPNPFTNIIGTPLPWWTWDGKPVGQQSGSIMSQGGWINDPRWTNGTWGGGTLNTIGLPR